MKIVVLGIGSKAESSIENTANDSYRYVSNVDNALRAVEQDNAEMLVIENEVSLNGSLSEVIVKLSRMPQDVRIIMLSPSRHYFIVANNTLRSSINYHITYY